MINKNPCRHASVGCLATSAHMLFIHIYHTHKQRISLLTCRTTDKPKLRLVIGLSSARDVGEAELFCRVIVLLAFCSQRTTVVLAPPSPVRTPAEARTRALAPTGVAECSAMGVCQIVLCLTLCNLSTRTRQMSKSPSPLAISQAKYASNCMQPWR